MVMANSYRVLFATTYRPVGSESWTMSIPLGVTLSGFNPLVSGLMTFTLIGSMTVQASGTLAERDVATGVAVISLTVPDAPAGNAFVSGAAFTEAAALLASQLATDPAMTQTSQSNFGDVKAVAVPSINIQRRTANTIFITFSASAFALNGPDAFIITIPSAILLS